MHDVASKRGKAAPRVRGRSPMDADRDSLRSTRSFTSGMSRKISASNANDAATGSSPS